MGLAEFAFTQSCGTTTISSQHDVDSIKQCPTITGDIVIATDAVGRIQIDGVESVGGSINASGSRITSFDAPSLKSVASDIAFSELNDVQDISFPQLGTVGGKFDFAALPLLSSLNISGFNETSRLRRLSLQDVPKLRRVSIYTPTIGELLIAGNGSLEVGLEVDTNLPKSFEILSVGGCSSLSGFFNSTTVGNFTLFQNTFAELDLTGLRVNYSMRILENPNLEKISLPNPSSLQASQLPPSGPDAPQWKHVDIGGNPRLDSSNITLQTTSNFWDWGAQNLSTMIFAGNFHSDFFYWQTTPKGKYPDTSCVYTTDRFGLNSTDPLFDCEFLNALRYQGLFRGNYSCQGKSIPSSASNGGPSRRIYRYDLLMGIGISLGALTLQWL
ncbi:hypothetical protein F4779DRAFT_481470 [Xylariaceae sp. FL0662B]|nr:hypothetical protein F4779DRAFT_481470 [Xylariaceae sp. FL0662B]